MLVMTVAVAGMLAWLVDSEPNAKRTLSAISVPLAVKKEKLEPGRERTKYSLRIERGRVTVATDNPETATEARSKSGEAPRGESAGPEGELLTGPAAQQVEQRAYPRAYVESSRAVRARTAFNALERRAAPPEGASAMRRSLAGIGKAGLANQWQELGPTVGTQPGDLTYTGRATQVSGRVTALAIDPNCSPTTTCRLWVAAAGGGIWRTTSALGDDPNWQSVSSGLPTTSFGSIYLDPNDSSGNTLYAGSGEGNGSDDSEAGLGLFKSTNGGDSWSLVAGSVRVAHDRAISAITIDPNDANTIYIGTALARHGASAVFGGRVAPPGAPTLGVYRSTNGGKSFALTLAKQPNQSDPAEGSDWFTGGVSKLIVDPNDAKQVYAAVRGYGIFRLHNPKDGVCSCDDGQWHQIYQALYGEGSFVKGTDGNLVKPDQFGSQVSFDLVSKAGATRIYVGEGSDEYAIANLIVGDGVDSKSDGEILSDELLLGSSSKIWSLRSASDVANPASFSSYNFCQNVQCGYDLFVVADPSAPDTVWLGGSMAYDELEAFGSKTPRSNGRAVVRSTDAGVSFTDMTNDSRTPPQGLPPDQHALVLNPKNHDQALIGSDGGVWRTNGQFVDGNPDDSVCGKRSFTESTAASDLAFCRAVLSSIPERIDSLNAGLNTLQFQALAASTTNPETDLIAGTQDNGTWGSDSAGGWSEVAGGDGGAPAIDSASGTRMHSYYGPSPEVQFDGDSGTTWFMLYDRLVKAETDGESFSFYVPLISDPKVGGTYFTAGEWVWRTKDSGGDPDFLKANCSTWATHDESTICGDFEQIGPRLSPDGPGGKDYVVALGRSAADSGTLWAGLHHGELFVSSNADAEAGSVKFTQLKDPMLPNRFVSGIAVDPKNPNHAWISFSGYGAYTPGTPAHLVEATFNPITGQAVFADRSYNIGDQPLTGIASDSLSGDTFSATDFGVARLPSQGRVWADAAAGLPPVAVYGLTINPAARILYAATHGRGIYRLPLDPVARATGPATGYVGNKITFRSTGSAGYGGLTYQWTLPGGKVVSGASANFTPTLSGRGKQTVSLTVTDSLGHKATATTIVNVPGLVGRAPVLSTPQRVRGGYGVQITNFSTGWKWSATVTAGRAAISPKGTVYVRGLRPLQTARLTVTSARSGHETLSKSVTSSALER